jgi:hypothetical protein
MIENLLTIFTSRELATIFWVGVLAIWVLSYKTVRESLWGVIKSIFSMWKYFLLLLLYISLFIFLLYKISLWNTDLLKVTIYWIFGWSIIAFVNINRIHNEKGYLRKVAIEIAGLAVLIAFFVNFYTFPFWFELFLVPFAVLLSLLSVVAGMKQEQKQVHEFLGYVQITFGTAILFFCLYQAITDISAFANFTTLHEFLLPVVLSVMLLPFLYLMSMYGEYEQRKIREKYLNIKK